MKPIEKTLEKRTLEALTSCLSRVPFLKAEDIKRESASEDTKPDLIARLSLPEGERLLVIEVKGSGQPRTAREAVNQLLRYTKSYPNAYGVFAAPYISPRAAEICAQDGIGYLDLVGNCRLTFDNVYIEYEGKPNLFASKRELRSLYSPRAERVLRVLLNNARTTWKMAELAKEAQVSLGQVFNVKKLLTDREWIRSERTGGIALTNPDELLREWEGNYSFRKNTASDFYSIGGPGEIESAIAEFCTKEKMNYAFTGFSGAAKLAPAVRYQRVMVYVEAESELLISQLSLKRVSSGANVSLLTPYDEGVFYGGRDVDSCRLASPIQIYLDLRNFRGRGEEAAQVILDQVIKPAW